MSNFWFSASVSYGKEVQYSIRVIFVLQKLFNPHLWMTSWNLAIMILCTVLLYPQPVISKYNQYQLTNKYNFFRDQHQIVFTSPPTFGIYYTEPKETTYDTVLYFLPNFMDSKNETQATVSFKHLCTIHNPLQNTGRFSWFSLTDTKRSWLAAYFSVRRVLI
jgi:hypothetical protein